MLNSGNIVGLTVNQMLQVWRGEVCLVIYGLVASFKAEKRKVNVGDAWFQVLPWSLFVSVSVALSLSQLEFWSVDSCLPSFDLSLQSRNLSFILFFSFDQIKLGFLCFLPWKSRIGWITFDYFYFLTNLINSSLCTDPLCRDPFFHFEESPCSDNIQWMLSWMPVAIIILCIW